MLLRRITKHVKAQNWFAVFLDFIIVVFGIWVALIAGQWADNRQDRAALKNAEHELNTEILGSYFHAHERLSIASCRADRYQHLGEMLLNGSNDWPGTPNPYGAGTLTKYRVFPLVLRSPLRPWEYSVWDTELSKGTLAIMENEKRQLLSELYIGVKGMARSQKDLYLAEARLQALAAPLEMTGTDRLKYYDRLIEADAISAALELGAEQLIDTIETNRLVTLSDEHLQILGDFSSLEDYLRERNRLRRDIYGDCTSVIALPLLERSPSHDE
jgi:hypothetical protein